MKRNITLLFSLLLFLGFIQYGQCQDDVKFTSFGSIPLRIDSVYYQAIKNATNEQERFEAYEDLGKLHHQHGNSDSVIYYGNRMKDVFENMYESDQYNSRSDLMIGLGKIDMGMHDEALKFLISGISLTSNSESPELYYSLKLGLGRVYLAKNEFDQATKHFRECINESNNSSIKIESHKFLGDLFLLEKEFEVARKSYSLALELMKAGDMNRLRLEIQLNMAKMNFSEGKVDAALKTLEETNKVSLEKKYFDIYVDAVLGIGEIYMQQENFEVANAVLSSAYINSVQWNWLELQQKIQSKLIQLHVDNGDYKNAYGLMTQYVQVSKQVVEDQSREGVRELDIKYKTLQKENEILALKESQLLKETELSKQKTIKNSFLIGFLIILIPILGLLYLYYQKLQAQSQLNLKNEELKKQEVTSLMKEQELKLALASVEAQETERGRIAQELHDSIGGNLAAIKLQMEQLDGGTNLKLSILNQVDETYQQVRGISHDLTPRKFENTEFTTWVEDYIGRINSSQNIEIVFRPYPKKKVNKLNQKLQVELYKILQELLTNTVKHADAKNVEIHMNVHESEVQLIYEDDGKGYDKNSSRNGIGLQNIFHRVASLKGNVNLDSEMNRGTAYTMQFPLNLENDK